MPDVSRDIAASESELRPGQGPTALFLLTVLQLFIR